ncbi:MAG: ornithine racemase Orr [Bacillota bacterium]
MRYPALIIDTNKIRDNTRLLADKCKKHGISVAGVTKVFCAIPDAARAMIDGGAYMLADSRIENGKKLSHMNIPKLMLRLPMLSQVDDIVDIFDISLNSEYDTIKALSDKAIEKGKIHNVIMMVDLGDLREGVWYEDAVELAGKILELKGIKLLGVGVNLTCYGGVIPTYENLSQLVEIAEEIEKKYAIKLEVISGGNSSSIHLLDKGEMPKRINQLRLGESIVLGFETAYGDRIEGTHRDAFKFAAQIIEIKEKPSVPIGEIGMDAFGQKPVFEDKGIIKRAIVGAGRQDIRPDGIVPKDEKISVLGASSDHLILDVTESESEYKVGDIVEFDLTYGGLLAACTSEYVEKIIV